jgi:hypothetical protein
MIFYLYDYKAKTFHASIQDDSLLFIHNDETGQMLE